MKFFAPSNIFISDDSKADNDWMVWPDSCMLLSNRPLFVPDFEKAFYALPALAGKIGRLGKSIAERFAYRYVNEIAAALIIFPESALKALYAGINPPAGEFCFDNALVVGDFFPYSAESDQTIRIQRISSSPDSPDSADSESLEGSLRAFYPIISSFSRRNTLKMGDVVLAPLPARPIKIEEGSSLRLLMPQVTSKPALTTNFR